MENTEIIENFYTAFAAGDAEKMVSFYDDAIEFEDPAFGKLKGLDAKNMWRMLISRSNGNLNITYSDISADANTGIAKWRAEYPYSATGRKVVNEITARFEFANGKIIKHRDHFDLWKWTRQALGWKGWLLGWSSFMRNKIQAQTGLLLQKFSSTQTRTIM